MRYYILYKTVLLLYWNITHRSHLVYISVTPADSVYPHVPLFNCYSQCSKCRPFAQTQARRRFLHSLIALSVMFCSRPIHSRFQPVASWVHPHSWTSSDRPAVTWSPELVIDQNEVRAVGGATDPERWSLRFRAPTVRSFCVLMRWCTVLLKHERVTSDTFDSRKYCSK